MIKNFVEAPFQWGMIGDIVVDAIKLSLGLQLPVCFLFNGTRVFVDWMSDAKDTKRRALRAVRGKVTTINCTTMNWRTT